MKNFWKILFILIFFVVAVELVVREFVDESGSDKSRKIELYKAEVFNTDIDFYNESKKIGLGKAFIKFAADSVILMRENELPVIGRQSLRKYYSANDTNVSPLKWKPQKVDVSPDGELGYTYGTWEYSVQGKDGKIKKQSGNYVTIWKKQNDGSWKYVLDGGTTFPSIN